MSTESRPGGIPRVKIIVDDAEISVCAGANLAASLAAAGIRTLRYSPRAGMPRGMFCLMGVCQECVVEVDGRRVPACLEEVRAAMVVRLDRRSAYEQ